MNMTNELVVMQNHDNADIDELLFLDCDKTERKRLIEFEVTRGKLCNSPALKIAINVLETGYSEVFWLVFTLFGFNFKKACSDDIVAYTIFNRNLALDYKEVDIEFLRGLAALGFMNLEVQIDQHIKIFDLIYSPAFNEYLYKCLGYIKAKRS